MNRAVMFELTAGTGLIWLGVFFAWVVIYARTWRVKASDGVVLMPGAWPDVVAVVPARDEAAVIATSIGSLVAQQYPGRFRVIVVDDESRDDTADLARRTADGWRGLEVIRAGERPPGWTGKLWAVSQGVALAGEPEWLWLTDADIEHTPNTLRALVSRAQADELVLNSRMALLRTETFAERAIVPAFVFFFRMLYPFGRVNDPSSRVAAAAGGCMLVRRDALARAGGVATIRGALIDDVAMGRLMKRQGAIRIALTHASKSLRAYGWADLWAMVARSAFAQLRYSTLALIGSVVGLFVLFWLPVFELSTLRIANAVPYTAMVGALMPLLGFYRLRRIWALAFPVIAMFFLAATLSSAVQHWRGRGGMWKGRAQATGMPA